MNVISPTKPKAGFIPVMETFRSYFGTDNFGRMMHPEAPMKYISSDLAILLTLSTKSAAKYCPDAEFVFERVKRIEVCWDGVLQKAWDVREAAMSRRED
jgi:hypothetical protein